MHVLFITILAFLLSIQAAGAADDNLPTHNPVPGGVAVFKLDWGQEPTPEAYLNSQPLLVTRIKDSWYAIAGISLETEPGKYEILVTDNNGNNRNYPFVVKQKKYSAQYLRVKNKRHVEPNKEDIERILGEKEEISRLLSTFSPVDAGYFRFKKPVKGRLSSRFGLRRFFNKKPRNRHSGLDIAAKLGTPINAPLSGRVIGTGNYFFSGNLVFLDHGQGLISTYAHLDKISVKPGQQIKTGDIIGEVGSTGRVTGPHLHWSIYLNQTRVDPELFM